MKRFIAIIFFSLTAVYAQQNFLFPGKYPSNSEQWIFNSYADSTSGTWSYIASYPQPLYGIVSCYIPSVNKILVCGGINSSNIPQRKCYLYNPVSNTYSPADSLPVGRAFGKLVLVRDSVYLVGSVNSNFNVPDGALYKYSLDSSKWIQKAGTLSPLIQEMAVVVWKDSLIITIGGSTSGFSGVTASVRIYNPFTNTWNILTSAAAVPFAAAHAELLDTNLVVVGGYGYAPLNKIYYTPFFKPETDLNWSELGPAPFGISAYRVAGGHWADYMLFGPAIHDTLAIPQIWGLKFSDTTWRKFQPNMPDSISNISTVSVIPLSDSAFFYVFGGNLNNETLTSKSLKYAFANPYIGISGNSQKVPGSIKLFQNYPNPFNPRTVISYQLAVSSELKIAVYDVLGKEIAVLLNEKQNAGQYEIEFDGSNISSGIYFYTLTSGDFRETKKMLIVK